MTYKTTIKGKEFNIEVASQDSRSLNIKVENEKFTYTIAVNSIFTENLNNIGLNNLRQRIDKLILKRLENERLI